MTPTPFCVHLDLVAAEGALCEGYAAAWALRRCAKDEAQPLDRRVVAAIVCAWIRTHDPDIVQMRDETPWAAALTLQCLCKYPCRETDSNTLREYHPIAMSALEQCGID